MTSDAQLIANRLNAQRSTGPNTLQSKEKSSKNARKRRLPGDLPLTLIEDEAAFAAHHEALQAALSPYDAFEAELVRQIALHQWRLGRLQRIEAALFDAETYRIDYARAIRPDPSALRTGRAPPPDIWPARMEELTRREAALDRALARAIALLERRQEARRRDEKISGNEANLPNGINGAG